MISSMKKSRKRIWIGIIVFLIINLIASVILTKVIYDHTFDRHDPVAEVPAALTDMVAERQVLEVPCGDIRLCGYLYRGSREGLVVLAPGYHAGADDYLWQIKSFLDYGWGVFAFDPTGCCRSEGDSNMGFSRILYDLEGILRYIEEQDRFGYRELLLFGHSRGGYGVCGITDEHAGIAAAVSVSGVNSCMEAIMQPVADKIGFLAYGNYPLLWLYQSSLFGSEAVNTDAVADLAESGVPALIVQGEGDIRFPPDRYSIYAHGQKSDAENIEYYLCAGGHTDLLTDGEAANAVLMEKVNAFFAAKIGEN